MTLPARVTTFCRALDAGDGICTFDVDGFREICVLSLLTVMLTPLVALQRAVARIPYSVLQTAVSTETAPPILTLCAKGNVAAVI